MPNQHINVRFSLRADSLTGPVAYRETDTVTSNPLGIFTVVIGGGNIVNGNFGNLQWALTNYFLQVELDVTGGTTFTNMGTTQLITVPYAFYAASAGEVVLTSDSVASVSANTTVTVTNTSHIVIPSTVLPSSAVVTLTNGLYKGQLLYIEGSATSTNGVRFESVGNMNVGNSGGPVDLTNGAMLCLIWNGTHWLRVSYSSNQ